MDTTMNPGSGNESGNIAVSDSTGTIESKAREIGRRVDRASAKLQDSWTDATASVRSRLGTTREHLRHRVQQVGTQARTKLVDVRQKGTVKAREARAQVEEQVHAHPIRSLAWAFGAGAVLGLLLHRTRR